MVPLVSILIPAYNAERWIAETLRSALNQTWPNKEVILVDDGSSDQTLAVAREFEPAGVQIIAQQNQGAAAARNAAYARSRGDYIQWLDADDLLAPDKIERQVERAATLHDDRILLSGPWGTFSTSPARAHFQPTALWSDLEPVDWLIQKLGKNLHMQTATWLTSRVLAEASGAWDPSMWIDDDGEYFCRVLLQSHRVAFVPEAKVYYRTTDRHRLSLIARSEQKQDAMLTSLRAHITALRSREDSERVRAACLQYLQNWLPAFYPERPEIVSAMQLLASNLGGKLNRPRLPLKYAIIRMVLGWRAAKCAQEYLPHAKITLVNRIEKAFFDLTKARQA